MSALADFAHKFGSESRELKIGQSFFNDADSCFHTIRYDFVPASVDPNKTSVVDFGGNGKVTVTMPNMEGSGTGRESVYQGMRKPHQKECVLIFNPETGELVLEKLNTSMIVKKARLRQEDMSSKSLTLNSHNNIHKATLSNGSSSGTSISQAKSSNHNDKAKSSTLKSSTMGHSMPNMANVSAKLPNKTSPPLSSTSSTGLSAPRTNGFHPKTPSPPSMPIFSANKGSLLHTNGASVSKSSESSFDWNGGIKSKEPPPPVSAPKSSHKNGTSQPSSNRSLSDESSSDSDANSDDEDSESSSQSSGSSSDEEMRNVSSEPPASKQLVSGTTVNALSMPSFLSSMSMPNSLVARSSGLDSTSPNLLSQHSSSSSNHAKSPPESSKKAQPTLSSSSALSLSLSEDSDDSSDDEHRPPRDQNKKMNGSDLQHKKDLAKGVLPMEKMPKSASFLDSMPKFTSTSNGSAPGASSTFPSMPKVTYSQLSQDLQLSESGSDSDD